jgi:hypothetical protein
MEMKIYEDQTGLVFPYHNEKNERAVTFFNKGVDLYIDKKDERITIYCFVLAHKSLARDQGYYIVSDNSHITYSIFNEFKKNATKLLLDLELQPLHGDMDNAIFDNLDKFDLKEYSYAGNIYKDTDIISDIIYKEPNMYLDYRGSDIAEILIFCYQLLKTKNVKIAVSSEEIKLCNINILRNKKSREPLVPSSITIQILDNYRRMQAEKKLDIKRKEEIERGKNELIEGFDLIKDGIRIFKDIGRDPTDVIIDEIIKVTGININSKVVKRENNSIDDDEKKGTTSHIILITIFGIIMVILGIIIGIYLIKHYGMNVENLTIYK